jgi:hypothetical protein
LWKIKVEGKVKCFLVYGSSPGGKFGVEEGLPHTLFVYKYKMF